MDSRRAAARSGVSLIGAVTGSPLAQDKASVLLATPGVKSLIFGLIIIFFIIYEPMGLDGRWMKIKTWVTQFPFYRPATFRRQKMYLKSERGR